MEKNISVVFSGVGGQGVLLASNLLAHAAITKGLDVKQAEVHGMSQRGGSVISHVRFGPKVHSPTVETGGADILCALEPLEALRYAEYLAPDGLAAVNTGRIAPLTTVFGDVPYPDDPGALLREKLKNVVEIEATRIAVELGVAKAVNVVMLGAVSSRMPFTDEEWNAAIEAQVKAKFVDKNKKAFAEGKKAADALKI